MIVEDEFLVAMDLENFIAEIGHEVAACFSRLDEAVQFARHEDVDFAILDLNLHGEKSFPVAETLRQRSIPFVFATGYGSAGLNDEFGNVRTLQKPYSLRELKRVIEEAFMRPGTDP